MEIVQTKLYICSKSGTCYVTVHLADATLFAFVVFKIPMKKVALKELRMLATSSSYD